MPLFFSSVINSLRKVNGYTYFCSTRRPLESKLVPHEVSHSRSREDVGFSKVVKRVCMSWVVEKSVEVNAILKKTARTAEISVTNLWSSLLTINSLRRFSQVNEGFGMKILRMLGECNYQQGWNIIPSPRFTKLWNDVDSSFIRIKCFKKSKHLTSKVHYD